MYGVSEAYETAIKSVSRRLTWYGTITLTDGTVHDFDLSNIVENTATITKQASSSSSIDIGGVYASELTMTLRISIEPSLLSKAVISLTSRLIYQNHVETWEDAAPFNWNDMKSTTWGANPKELYCDIPMGMFTIAEATKSAKFVKITAYDNMLKFENTYKPDDKQRTAYDWLKTWAEECGVKLASTRVQIMSLVNGNKLLNLSIDKGDSISYRTALGYLATACCAVAIINRSGELELLPYKLDVDDILSPSHRYSSQLSTSNVYYTEMYATYKKSQATEHYVNTSYTGENSGLSYNVGVNPFLQITDGTHRQVAIQTIIDKLATVQYVPFEASIPCHPEYDLLDVIQFTGGQSGEQDLGAITTLVVKINDASTISCSGANSDLLNVSTDTQQEVQYISDNTSYNSAGSTNIWILFDDSSDESSVSTEAKTVNNIIYQQSTDLQKLVISYTGDYVLDADCDVCVDVLIDNKSVHISTDKQTIGKHSFSITIPYLLEGTGQHELIAQMKTNTGTAKINNSKLSVIGIGYNNNVSYDSGEGDFNFDYIKDLIDQGVIKDFNLIPSTGFEQDLEIADNWSDLLGDMDVEFELDDGTTITVPGLDVADELVFQPDEIDWEHDPVSGVEFMGLEGLVSPGIMNVDPLSNILVNDDPSKDLRNLDNWSQNRPTHFVTSYNKTTNVNTVLVSGHSPYCGTWWNVTVPNLDAKKRYGFIIHSRAVGIESFTCEMTINGKAVSYTISGGCQVLLPVGATSAVIHVQPDEMKESEGMFSVYNIALKVVADKDKHYYKEL